MKTKLLISLFGLIPALVMAEATVSGNPRTGETVTYAPSSVSGETANGVEYSRTTTAPGVRTLEITGPNGGYYDKTSTSIGNSTTNAESNLYGFGNERYKKKTGEPGDEKITKLDTPVFGTFTRDPSKTIEELKKGERPPLDPVCEPGPCPKMN